MSRWLWALLAGVVLVAIAAVFWIDQTSVATPGLAGRHAGRTCARSRLDCAERRALGSVLTFAPGRAGGGSPAALRLRRPMQDSKPPRRPLRPRRPPKSPRLPRSSRRSLRPRLLPLRPPKRRCRRPRPDGRRRKSRAYMRPRASRSWSGPGPIPQRIASGSSSGAAAAGPIGSRWTSSPRPRLSSRRRRSFSLPPSAGLRAHPKWKACSRSAPTARTRSATRLGA